MSQFYHPDTGTQPTPVVTPPQQTPIPPMQPPRKQVPKKSKFAISFFATLLFVAIFLVIGIIAKAGNAAPSPTINMAASDNLTATALTNQYATEIATSEVGLSNDLTQTAMTPTAQPTTPVVATTGVGSTQSSGVWSITVNSIKTAVSDNEFEVPKIGNEYILINFTALNTDSAAHDMNPFYYTLRDDSGTSYDFTGLTIAANPDGTVVGGQKLRGDLSYEIPKSVRSLTLQFDSPDDLDNSQIVQWNLIV